ncbi:unnamed protein product, partial [Mesorhabditis belari]|uniref:Uncharacterized protein n=1 Tax=Mesorhabditis belari TaxID=2138241 RepID=A0AAF3E9W8_9BILA
MAYMYPCLMPKVPTFMNQQEWVTPINNVTETLKLIALEAKYRAQVKPTAMSGVPESVCDLQANEVENEDETEQFGV